MEHQNHIWYLKHFETTNEMITGLYPPWLCFKALCLSFHISDQHLGTIELKKITSVTTIAWKAPVAFSIEFCPRLPLKDGPHFQTHPGSRGIKQPTIWWSIRGYERSHFRIPRAENPLLAINYRLNIWHLTSMIRHTWPWPALDEAFWAA